MALHPRPWTEPSQTLTIKWQNYKWALLFFSGQDSLQSRQSLRLDWGEPKLAQCRGISLLRAASSKTLGCHDDGFHADQLARKHIMKKRHPKDDTGNAEAVYRGLYMGFF